MIKTVIVIVLIAAIVLFFIFGLIPKLLSKKKSEEPLHEIDKMAQQSEMVTPPQETVTKPVRKKRVVKKKDTPKK